MGIRHANWPHSGVQFHPESVATSYGRQIFKNFREITQDYWLRSSSLSSDRNIHYIVSIQVPHVNRLVGAVHTGRQSVKKADFQFNGEACSDGQFMRGADQRNLGHFDMVNVLPLSMHTKFLRLKWRKFDHLASEVGGARNIFSELFGWTVHQQRRLVDYAEKSLANVTLQFSISNQSFSKNSLY